MMELDTKQQDDIDNARESANLAKNIATGNAIGTAKSAVKLSKNKKMRRIILIKLLLPVIIIVMLTSILFSIFNAVAEVAEKVKDWFKNITEFIDPEYTDCRIKISDEKIDQIISNIQELGVSLDSLNLVGDVELESNQDDEAVLKAKQEKALRKYIKAFLEAQMVTEVPYPGDSKATGFGAVYGNVYIYRANDTNKQEKLTYTTEDLTSKDEDFAMKHFSIDIHNGNLLVASKTVENTNIIKQVDGQEVTNNKDSNTNITTVSIPYKAVVSQYSTSMQFLLYLSMITQNPEFALELANRVKNSEIDITITDIENITKTKETFSYTEHEKIGKTRAELLDEMVKDGVTLPAEAVNYTADDLKEIVEENTVDREITEIIEKTITNIIPSANVTYVNTWFTKQKINFTKPEQPTIIENSYFIEGDEMADELEPMLNGNSSVTWITDKSKQITESTSITSFNIESSEVKKEDIEQKIDEFIKMLDKKYKIPKTNRKEAPGLNLVDGAEWFFNLLQKDDASQNLEIWMRYMLYKYTGEDYGVKELDTSMFAIQEFRKINSLGALNITSTNLTKEDFVEKTQSYSGAINKGSGTKTFRESAELIYDICVSNNINPVLCAGQAWKEQNWDDPNTSPYNYWGIAVYNGQNYGKKFTSITDAVQGYCYQINSQINGSLKSQYQARANEFASVNNKFKGDMSNMYDIFSAYAYIGKGYTLEEEADYAANYVESIVQCAKQIYGNEALSLISMGGNITTDEECVKLTEQYNQMLNTKIHSSHPLKGMSAPYQLGPYERWWTAGYNNLQPFQCTWWANGRASMYLEEKYGKKYPTQYGDGKDYYQINISGGWFNYGQIPKPNSIISWSNGSYGHVAYVEGVTDDGIYISHAGGGQRWFGVQKIPLNGDLSSLGWGYKYRLNGYIYLDEPINF